jgi:hypothetical protein
MLKNIGKIVIIKNEIFGFELFIAPVVYAFKCNFNLLKNNLDSFIDCDQPDLTLWERRNIFKVKYF